MLMAMILVRSKCNTSHLTVKSSIMKSVLPALSFVLLFASCTTAYKSGQTPDDVYFSPQRPQDEYVRIDDKKERYQYDDRGEDDRYLRMKVRNRQLWSDLDFYYNDPFAYRYNLITPPYFYSTPWNYYNSWNYYYNPYAINYYNPYATKVYVINPKSPNENRPRMTNLNVYNNVGSSYGDGPASSGKTRVFGSSSSQGSSSPRRSNAGDNLRNIFSSNSNNSNSSSTNNAPVRSTQSSSTNSSSSSSSSSGSTNAPVRKF
jgi:hypothetical protein